MTVVATPTTTSVGEPVTFAVTVTAGSSAVTAVSLNFGDGTARELGALAGATNVAHTYTFAGTFQVVATVTDSSGETVTVATLIVVEAAAPLNVTITAPATVQVDVAATFTATVIAAGTLEIDRDEWDFGDGQTAVTSGSSTSHVYTSAGLKVATVRAVEKDGRTGTGLGEVNVTPRSPLNVNLSASPSPGTVDEVVTGSTQTSIVVAPQQIVITMTASPTSPTTSSAVTFTATVSPPTVVVTSYLWEFGDASSTTLTTTSNSTIFPGYGVTWDKTAKVTATLFDGSTVTTSVLVTVTP